MQLPAIFFLQTWDPHATPYPLFPRDIAQKHSEQLMHIEAICLRSTVTTIACNAGRVHDDVLHPLSHSTAVEPEPIPAGLVTTADAGVIR